MEGPWSGRVDCRGPGDFLVVRVSSGIVENRGRGDGFGRTPSRRGLFELDSGGSSGIGSNLGPGDFLGRASVDADAVAVVGC